MKADLERRIAELCEEIRRYPGPIARCDEHLPALLEERSRLMRLLDSYEEPSCTPESLWLNDGGNSHAA